MKVITSTSNEMIKRLVKLKQKKYRDLYQEYLIEGDHLVKEAYEAKHLKMILTTHKENPYDVDGYLLNEDVLAKLSNHQSTPKIIGVALIPQGKVSYQDHLLVLENIQDPGNLGSILRNASAFNLNNIIISNDCVDLYNHKVVNSSQGAIFKLKTKRCDLTTELLTLKNENYTLIGTSLRNAKILTKDQLLEKKSALFFGNEGQGLSKDVLSKMDLNYYIKSPGMESLNVACAHSIMMYQFFG